jgi:uncharacterized protein YbjT (DUF2867 family)
VKIAVAGGTGTVGRHVVDVAREHGHDTVLLSRTTGVDLVTGSGLRPALEGADVVVDVSSVGTRSADTSREFFRAVTLNLLRAEEATGVGHHVALSIVGAERAPFGYYAGKALQEELLTRSRVPWTVLRATQFHEFAEQVLGQATLGPVDLVPVVRSRPVAVREVGERLVELAGKAAAGRVRDLAGPEVLRMVDMVRAYARATGRRGPVGAVPLPGGFGRALRDGTILPGPEADRGRETFTRWLERR